MKTKKVFFSRTVFLQQVIQSKNKLNKLKYLAVLIARVLALLFLIFAIYNFFRAESSTDSDKKFGAFFIDNSLSIDTQNERALESIKRYVLADEEVYESSSLNVNDLDKKGLYFYKKSLFKELVDEVELSTAKFDLSKVIARYNHIKRISSLDDRASEMVLISDFQKPIMVNEEHDFTNWKIVKLDNDFDKFNVIIDSAWLESPFVELTKANQLSVNYSSSGMFESNINCKLFIDNIQVASSSINETKGVLHFDFTIDNTGNHACRLEVDDDVVFDNTHFFTMTTGNKISIAVITEELGNNLLKKVYSNEPTFEVSAYAKTNLSVDELSRFNVIVFDQVKGSELLARLVKHNSSERTFVYIPPADLGETDLLLNELKNHVGVIRLLDDTTSYSISSNINKEFFDGVFSDDKNTKFDFTTSRKMIDLSQNRGASLVSFLDRSPLLLMQDKLFVFTVPLINDFTKIHHHALFVPMMYKIAMSSTPVNTQLSYAINDLVKLRGDFSVSDKISLRSKDKNILIDFRLGPNAEIVFDAGKYNIQPGIYDLVKNDSTYNKIAFNLNKNESVMEFYSEEELKNMFPAADVTTLSFDKMKESFHSDIKTSVSFWKYCLTLSLMMLFVEIILINYLK